MDYLVIAKQRSHKAPGMVYYVNDKGVYVETQLFGKKWDYKVYNKNGVYVEDSKGKILEKPERKAKQKKANTQKLRNPSNEEVRKDGE